MNEEHDDLWEFLGKGREQKASSFFTANVMRKVREEIERPRGFAALALWLRRKWFFPLSAAACAVAVFASLPGGLPISPSGPSVDDMAVAVAESSELNLIADLDTLVAADDNAIWLEADPSSLF